MGRVAPFSKRKLFRVPRGKFLGFSIGFDGSKEIVASLGILNEKMQKKLVQQACDHAMQPILAKTQNNSPVKTGMMKMTFGQTRLRKQRFNHGSRILSGTRAELGIDPKNKYYYPAAVELGTKNLGGEKFMRSTLLENQTVIQKNFGDKLWQLMKPYVIKAGKKLNRQAAKAHKNAKRDARKASKQIRKESKAWVKEQKMKKIK